MPVWLIVAVAFVGSAFGAHAVPHFNGLGQGKDIVLVAEAKPEAKKGAEGEKKAAKPRPRKAPVTRGHGKKGYYHHRRRHWDHRRHRWLW